MPVDYKALKDGGFMRQVQKDNFSLRLKVVGGNLTTAQLDTISSVSKQYGDGHVHLTSRQGVEIPFIKLGDIDAVNAALLEGGVNTSVCGPRVRTVTACQGNAICQSGCIDTYPLALDISNRYFGRRLPHKFKIGITGCVNNCLKAEENDVGIKGGYIINWLKDKCTLCGACVKVCRVNALSKADGEILVDSAKCNNCGRCVKVCPFDSWAYESGYVVSFGGTFGNRIAFGEKIMPIFSDREKVFKLTDAALAFFDERGKAGERFRVTVDRAGWDVFTDYINDVS